MVFVVSWDGINPVMDVKDVPTHDKNQWLLLQFIVFLMMETKGFRNM